jgi:hypothetical protein
MFDLLCSAHSHISELISLMPVSPVPELKINADAGGSPAQK